MTGSGLKQRHQKRKKETGRGTGHEEYEVEAGVLVTTASETAIPPDDDQNQSLRRRNKKRMRYEKEGKN